VTYVWRCGKCGKGCLLTADRPVGIVARAHKCEEAHVRVSPGCAKENGSLYLSAAVQEI
jgi:hypothetical protein